MHVIIAFAIVVQFVIHGIESVLPGLAAAINVPLHP